MSRESVVGRGTPAWEQAKELVGACLPKLPDKARFRVGPFLYDRIPGGTFFTVHLGEDSYSKVRFNLIPGSRSTDQFDSLTFESPDTIYELEEDRILVTTVQSFENPTHPSFEFHWRRGGQEEEIKGKLAYVRVDITSGAYVIYDIFEKPSTQGEIGSFKRYGKDREALKKAPPSLEDVKELFGAPILWEIDFNQVAEGILNASRLAELSQAVQAL